MDIFMINTFNMYLQFFALLSLALLATSQAEYNYNEKEAKAANSASSSGEDFLSDYHTPSNNALNSEATPDGYDYVAPARMTSIGRNNFNSFEKAKLKIKN